MEAAGVPTAAWTPVDNVADGMAAIERYPVVLKFDGLAAGKGVVIAEDEAHARAALGEFLVERRFGAGRVVVEEHLDGEELSLLALCDGERARADGAGPGLQAHLRRRRGPEHRRDGLLLAGAGVGAAASSRSSRPCTSRSSTSCARRGTPFHGVLYAGLMLTADGPKVLEFNVALRRPRDAGRAAAAAHATCSSCSLRRRGPAACAGAELEWDERWPSRSCSRAPATRSRRDRRRDRRPRRGAGRASR